MSTISTEGLINAIKAEETDAGSWDNKLLLGGSIIKTTKDIAQDYKETLYGEPFIIKRNKRFERIVLATIAFSLTLLFGFGLFTQKDFSIIGSLFMFALLSLMYYAFYKNLTLPSLNYSITLTAQQIDFGDIAFSWDEIQETFVVYRPKGNGFFTYLILGLKNGELNRHDINNFITFTRSEKTISKAIEHFKKLHQTTMT